MKQAKARILATMTVLMLLCSVLYMGGAAYVQAEEQENIRKEEIQRSALAARDAAAQNGEEESGEGEEFAPGFYYGFILSDEEFEGFMTEEGGAGAEWLGTKTADEDLVNLIDGLEAKAAQEGLAHNYWIYCVKETDGALNLEIPEGVGNIGITTSEIPLKLDSLKLGANTQQVLLEGNFVSGGDTPGTLTLDYTNAASGKVCLRNAVIDGTICTDGEVPSGTLAVQSWNTLGGIDNIDVLELLPYIRHEFNEDGSTADTWDGGWSLEFHGKNAAEPIILNNIVCNTDDQYRTGNFDILTEKQEDGSFRLPVFHGAIDLGKYYNQDDDTNYDKSISLRIVEDMDAEGGVWHTVDVENGMQVAVLSDDLETAYYQGRGVICYDGFEDDDSHGIVDMNGCFLRYGDELFSAERLSSEDEFNGSAEEWNTEWIGDAGSFEAALALIAADSTICGEEGSGLYKIGVGNGIYGWEGTVDLGSLDLTEYANVRRLRIEGERWDEEGNVFRPDYHLSNVQMETGQSLLLAGMSFVCADENAQPEDDPINVTGEGTLILDTCRVFQALESSAQSAPVVMRYDNTLSMLTANTALLNQDANVTVERNLAVENLMQAGENVSLLFSPDAAASIGNIGVAGAMEDAAINIFMGCWWEESEEKYIYPQISIGGIAEEMSGLQITPYSVNEAAEKEYPIAADMYSWDYNIYGTEEMPYSVFECMMGPEGLSGNFLTLGMDAQSLAAIVDSDMWFGIAFSYGSMVADMDQGIRTGGNPSGLYISADSELPVWVPLRLGVVSMEHADVEAIPEQEWTGSQVRPAVTVTMEGELLAEGEDYILLYEDNVDAGTAKIIIRAAEGSRYYDEKIVEFTIKKKDKADEGQSGSGQTGTDPGKQTDTKPQPAPAEEKPVPAAGTAAVSGNFKVKVTVSSAAGGEVTVTGTKNKKLTSAVIPATVKIDGYTFKVTGIAKNAFKGCTKLKKVTIGKNVKTIGASAFSGCKALKTITVKSTVLKKVGKAAFKGIHAKAKIKVPKAKLKAYQKLFKGKGQKSTVKITK